MCLSPIGIPNNWVPDSSDERHTLHFDAQCSQVWCETWDFILVGNQQSCRVAHREKLLFNVNKTKELTVNLEKEVKKTPCLLRGSGWMTLASWESASEGICHGHHTYLPWQRQPRNNCTSGKGRRRNSHVSVNLYSRKRSDWKLTWFVHSPRQKYSAAGD